MKRKKKRSPRSNEGEYALALRRAERALEHIAARDGVTVDVVRKQIQAAMLSGLTSSDPAVRAAWDKIPHKGEVATPEEVIAYQALKLKK